MNSTKSFPFRDNSDETEALYRALLGNYLSNMTQKYEEATQGATQDNLILNAINSVGADISEVSKGLQNYINELKPISVSNLEVSESLNTLETLNRELLEIIADLSTNSIMDTESKDVKKILDALGDEKKEIGAKVQEIVEALHLDDESLMAKLPQKEQFEKTLEVFDAKNSQIRLVDNLKSKLKPDLNLGFIIEAGENGYEAFQKYKQFNILYRLN